MNSNIFTQADVISTYTTEQATQDGILFDVRTVNPEWERGLFSHVTVHLMGLGYFNGSIAEDDFSVNIPNLLDLLNQSLAIVRNKSENFTKFDTFFSGSIELPSGAQQEVFICQNETGKFTILLPSDY